MDTPPAELRPITAFLQRANELAKADPIISYWCSYHAAQLAMSLRPTAPESRAFLLSMLDQLEAARKTMEDNDAITDEAAGSAYVENFALKVFNGADAEDRAGKSTKATAKRFLAAVNFLELLTNFGTPDEETAAKIKYARWKAADIAKAFKEGRTPVPGPAGGLEDAPPPMEGDASLEDATEVERQLLGLAAVRSSPAGPRGMEVDIRQQGLSPPAEDAQPAMSPSYPFPVTENTPPSAPDSRLPDTSSASASAGPVFSDLPPDQSTPSTFPTLPAAHGAAPPLPPPQALSPPNAFPSAPPASAFPHAVFSAAPSLPPPDAPYAKSTPAAFAPAAPAPVMPVDDEVVDPHKVGDAQKHARWAISALNYDDLPTARKELRLALALIGG